MDHYHYGRFSSFNLYASCRHHTKDGAHHWPDGSVKYVFECLHPSIFVLNDEIETQKYSYSLLSLIALTIDLTLAQFNLLFSLTLLCRLTPLTYSFIFQWKWKHEFENEYSSSRIQESEQTSSRLIHYKLQKSALHHSYSILFNYILILLELMKCNYHWNWPKNHL